MKTFSNAIWDGAYITLYNGDNHVWSWYSWLKPSINDVIVKALGEGIEPQGDVSLKIRYKPLDKRNVTRKEINDALCRLESVSGTYYGAPYSGVVTDNRGITTRPYDVEIYIRLDKPVTVFSQERDSITINGGKVYNDLFASDARYLTTINELWE